MNIAPETMRSTERAGLWQDWLLRHLAIVLLFKLMALFTIWWLFFRVDANEAVLAPDVSQHISGIVRQNDISEVDIPESK